MLFFRSICMHCKDNTSDVFFFFKFLPFSINCHFQIPRFRCRSTDNFIIWTKNSMIGLKHIFRKVNNVNTDYNNWTRKFDRVVLFQFPGCSCSITVVFDFFVLCYFKENIIIPLLWLSLRMQLIWKKENMFRLWSLNSKY